MKHWSFTLSGGIDCNSKSVSFTQKQSKSVTPSTSFNASLPPVLLLLFCHADFLPLLPEGPSCMVYSFSSTSHQHKSCIYIQCCLLLLSCDAIFGHRFVLVSSKYYQHSFTFELVRLAPIAIHPWREFLLSTYSLNLFPIQLLSYMLYNIFKQSFCWSWQKHEIRVPPLSFFTHQPLSLPPLTCTRNLFPCLPSLSWFSSH